MDIQWVWISIGFGTWTQFFTHGFFHGRAKTVFMDMDMDLILFNPIHTRPIAILMVRPSRWDQDPYRWNRIVRILAVRSPDEHGGSEWEISVRPSWELGFGHIWLEKVVRVLEQYH